MAFEHKVTSKLKKLPSFQQVLEVFNLLESAPSGDLGDFLESLTEEQKKQLYTHKLLKNFDLLP